MSKYAVVYEAPSREAGNWSSYVPDLPGCVSVGDTLDECRTMMSEAIAAHLAFMRERGAPIPLPATVAETVEVAA